MDKYLDAITELRELVSPVRGQMPNNRHSVFWRAMIGNQVSPILTSTFALSLVGATLRETSLLKACAGVRMISSFVPIVYSAFFFRDKRTEIDCALQELAAVSAKLKPYCNYHEDALDRLARLSNHLIGVCRFYAILDTVTLIIPLAMNQDELEVKMWPWPEGRLWVVIGGVLQICLGTSFAYAALTATSLAIVLILSQAIIRDILADAFTEDSPKGVRELVILDVRLNAVGCDLRDLLAGAVASEMILLITPLISTVFAIQGVYDLFTFVSIPYIILFVIICYAGQQLDRSYEDYRNFFLRVMMGPQDADCRVAEAVYNGHWLDAHSSPTTLLVVMGRRGRPLGVEAAANIGRLDLDALGMADSDSIF